MPSDRTCDPYRVLFDHVSFGTARCRMVVELERVVSVEILDHNPAFAAFGDVMPRLSGALTRMRAGGRPVTLQLQTGALVLAIAAYPAGADEAMVVVEDVTAREELAHRARAAQNRFEQAFHGNAAAMVIAHQSDLRIIDVNQRWLEMFGAIRDEVIGRTSVELGLITESTAAARIAQHKRFVDGYDIELALLTRAGAHLTVLASARPIEIAEGSCTLTTLIDITARKHAEDALGRAEASLRELNIDLERRVQERTQDLEASNRDLEAFSSSVSHDLRAPLRTIHSFSAIVLEDFAADLPAEAKRLLTSIHKSGDRLRGLIDDLLAFAQLGRKGLRRTEVQLDPLVRSVLEELLASRALGDRLELRMTPLGTCNADPSLLRAVWTNLIDNALKYARDRAPMVIDIGRELRGDEIVYYVRDNGVGFDMRQAGRLFGVFQRLHSDSEFEGTGVGLANVRRIIERHHGRVTATSALGSGSKFEFTLGARTE